MINKQLADFSSNQKPRTAVKRTGTQGGAQEYDYIDDSRSDASYISHSQYSVGGSSHFSSALKKPPVFMNQQTNQSQHETSIMSSQISYEVGFPNAERIALDEEDKARQRKEEKEKKMKEFMNKTKKSAQAKLQEEKAFKQMQQEKELKEKERILKAKEYAKLQRGIVAKSTAKKGGVQILASDEPAGVHTNYHAQIKREQQTLSPANRDLQEVIPEVSEADERDRTQAQAHAEQEQQQLVNFGNNDQLDLVQLYQRIDQDELDKLGVCEKEALPEQAITDLHEYSMLQRFRQNRDFKQPAKPVKASNKTQASNKSSTYYNSRQTDKENKWWITGNSSQLSEQDQRAFKEKDRYLKALKALVKEKGGKLDGGEIPSLCSCGALNENLQQMKKGSGKEGMVNMCASNCQFYKNSKDYEKALRDILHSISLFK